MLQHPSTPTLECSMTHSSHMDRVAGADAATSDYAQSLAPSELDPADFATSGGCRGSRGSEAGDLCEGDEVPGAESECGQPHDDGALCDGSVFMHHPQTPRAAAGDSTWMMHFNPGFRACFRTPRACLGG